VRFPRPSSRSDFRKALLLLGAFVVLGGCAVERGINLPDMPDWQARWGVLQSIREWSFSARIGVVSGDDGFNGRLRWRQFDERFEASVSGPLGAGTVRINGNRERITVTESDGSMTVLANPEADLYFRYGWTIPVNSLRFWALGIPDPDLPAAIDFGDGGTISRLDQGGWTVDIGQYQDGGGQRMPRRINAVNDDARVRLVIDDWVFY